MSDHAWVLENVAAYLAGGLEPAERERLEQHTAGCEPCTAAVAEARGLDAALSGLFADSRPAPALEDRVIQSLRTRQAETGLRLPVPGWLVFAAAALLLVGVTGAVASQMLTQDGLSFPRAESRNQFGELPSLGRPLASFQTDFDLGEQAGRKDVNQLAREWGEQMLGQLNGRESETHELRRPADVLHLPDSHLQDGTSNTLRFDEKIIARPTPTQPAEPNAAAPPVVMGNGSVNGIPDATSKTEVPPPVVTARPTMPAPPGGGMMPPSGGAGQGGPGMQFWMGFTRGDTGIHDQPNTPPQPGKPSQFYSFAPGKLFDDQQSTKEPKGLGGGSGKGSGSASGQAAPKPPSGGAVDPNAAVQTESEKEKTKDGGKAPAPDKVEAQAGPRKIVIRTGEVEYEVQSFDAAVATITRLLKNIKGGFVATVNSDKLANGKVRGSVVVRVPPESLDGLMLDLRTELSKGGELKNQRLNSLDVSKKYTDLESRLRAARAMEERLLKIIKDGKGEIKDLLAAERELGNWRERIEQVEGELRYYANQVALSTLTITLYEKEIQAPFGVVEREQVQMGVEVEDVDEAFQAAQKAVREAKGRITRSELKQHSQGQFSAVLHFEVAPDAAGPLRDRLRQLGTVARLDVSRQEETEGGTGKPSDGKVRRSDTRFQVSFYNLTDVAPRETVIVSLACVDVEATMKTLLARVEKAAGRVLASNLTRARSDQTQGDLQFQVKTPLGEAVLDDVKKAGEVMRLQVAENPDAQNTTRKKRGFHVQLVAQDAAVARETDEVQLACADVPAAYRAVQEAVVKAKSRIRTAQLNEQDPKNVTATLDFDLRRDDEAVLSNALKSAGDVYTRKATRAPDGDNVLDSKVRWQITFINQAAIPPRETYILGIEVTDVDQTAAMLSALVGERQGRTVESNVGRERSGRVTAKLVFDVPLGKAHELLDQLRSTGTVRVQQTAKHPEIPDSPLATARLDVTLSNKELIVPSDEGFGTSVRGGLADSARVLAWSLRILIFGLSILLPWALVVWAIYRLVVRLRRRSAPATPAA